MAYPFFLLMLFLFPYLGKSTGASTGKCQPLTNSKLHVAAKKMCFVSHSNSAVFPKGNGIQGVSENDISSLNGRFIGTLMMFTITFCSLFSDKAGLKFGHFRRQQSVPGGNDA